MSRFQNLAGIVGQITNSGVQLGDRNFHWDYAMEKRWNKSLEADYFSTWLENQRSGFS
jgi:hypothetical protein